MDTKISIIIPTFNRANLLAQTIESALDQDYANLEVIVSDNASTDNTADTVKKYFSDHRFKYFRNETNIGLTNNHRKAVYEYASGDFFVFLSDDDYLIDKQYMTCAARLIRENPSIVLVYANGYLACEGSTKPLELSLPFAEVEDGRNIFLHRGAVKPIDFTLCNVLFKREVALKLNMYANIHNMSSDSELFLKMCLCGKVGVIKNFVSVYRVHFQGVTNRIRSDLNLLIHNLDYLLEPYLLARQLKAIPRQELDTWERKLVIPEIKDTLITVLMYHKKEYHKALKMLAAKNSDPYKKAQRNILFRSRLFIAERSEFLHYWLFPSFRRRAKRERTKPDDLFKGKSGILNK